MDTKVLKDVERFSLEKHVHVVLFNGERTKVLLLCLSPGQAVPLHAHPGFEITLQPLRGKALLPSPEGGEVELRVGEVYFADGSMSFNPRNPFSEQFQMLIHLVKK
ncbi:MAG TPA: hypothetical protein DCP63_00945 [Bacteroidetes bacterium]|nr:hypothetical protein [Bacteroidota bacterium]